MSNFLETAWTTATSKNYFKRQDIDLKKQGSQLPQMVFLGVGIALTEWERAEENMGRLFGHLIGTPGVYAGPAAAKVYGSIESSAARVNMIRAAAEAFFGQHYAHPRIKKPLGLLLEAHKEASHRRNEIAHGVVLGPMTVNSKPLGSFLVAPDYHTDRNAAWPLINSEDDWSTVTRSLYRYNDNDLEEISGKFCNLSLAILYYVSELQPFVTADGQVIPHPKNLTRVLLEEAAAKQDQIKKKEDKNQ